MLEWKQKVAVLLPFAVIAFYALIAINQAGNFDFYLNYIGDMGLVDSGIGWFPLVWLVGAIPFTLLAMLSKQYGHPGKWYWIVLLSAFFALSAIGFSLDRVALHQISERLAGSNSRFLMARANNAFPAWLIKVISSQPEHSATVIEEVRYGKHRAFQIMPSDRAPDSGDEHVLYSEDGQIICEYGGMAGHVTVGRCDIDQITFIRTLFPVHQ